MTGLRIETPSRLHFGLLGWGAHAVRQFGGVGLMVEHPGLVLSARRSAQWQARGLLAERTLSFAERVGRQLVEAGQAIPALAFEVHRAPPEHVGLGTGTQLGLAVARAIAELSGSSQSVECLAERTGRGRRSGIGLHGFVRGGLIVDGGRRARGPDERGDLVGMPPLLARMEFPREWSVLLVIPRVSPGLHGATEVEAFRRLPPVPEPITDHLCRLVLLGLLPAVAERDLARFGEALVELQRVVGQCFAPAQGGIFAHPQLEAIAERMTEEGLLGVGQSSWGPTLYGFTEGGLETQAEVAGRIRERFGLGDNEVIWTAASRDGARACPLE
jgi:beta-ribofuranosylaminobenzene 5'-phosphate synthase